jgi:hypothetical protein
VVHKPLLSLHGGNDRRRTEHRPEKTKKGIVLQKIRPNAPDRNHLNIFIEDQLL